MISTTRRDALALFGNAAGALWIDPVLAAPVAARATVAPRSLSLDYRHAPAGIDTPRPRFGWTLLADDPLRRDLGQSACQVVVREAWTGGGVVYDSGKMPGTAMALAPDTDLAVQPQSVYVWSVRVWDPDGAASAWSAPQRFTTAAARTWRGRWIALETDGAITAPAIENAPAPAPVYTLPLLRRTFSLDKPVRHAVLCLSGLGCYDLTINDRAAAPALLDPGWTDYTRTVLFNTIEVTDLLTPGANVMDIALGGGMYDVQARAGRYAKWTGSFGAPKLIAQLRIVHDDGEETWIVSDEQWRAHCGPTTYASIYGGEDYDARRDLAGGDRAGVSKHGWAPAIITNGPGGELKPQGTPGLRVAHTFRTVAVTEPAPGIRVHDLGQNFAGRPVLAVRGRAGAVVTIETGELLDASGRVSQASMAAGPDNALLFTYTLGDTADVQVWRPRFSYSGFRYLEVRVDGDAQIVSLDGEFLHADLPAAGDFACSDDRLTRIHQLIRRAVLSNAATVLTDCPQREKLGWLEQTYLNAGTVFANLQALPLYDKMAGDMADAQLANGMVPSIAPEYVHFVDAQGRSTDFRDSPEWGSAAIHSPWAAYRFTGDIVLLRRAWPMMRRYADYLESRSRDGLVDFGLGDWYDIGPGPPGQPKLTSKTFVGSATWYADLLALARIADLLGHRDQSAVYTSRAALLKATINARLFQPDSARYDRGSQTAYAMALALDLVPAGHEARVLANLLETIHERRDHVSAGDIGFHYVVQALTAHGRGDVLYTMATRPDVPSYAAQLAAGATALTEAWDAAPGESQNHFMLGHIESWLFAGLAGIDIDFSRGDAEAIRIAPRPVEGVTWARASHTCPLGEVAVAWRNAEGVFVLDVTVPAGASARIDLPDYGLSSVRVGSGTFTFRRKSS
jgi:hypothetical protein